MAVKPSRHKAGRPPFDAATLERTALRYVERYATTRAKLAQYLSRKLRERGWAEAGSPPVEPLVERLASLGYVDDRAFAAARAAALGRRGFGARRVRAVLRAAGIGEEDGAEAMEETRAGAWAAALRFAERRRLGPFAKEKPDHAGREKALAALLRAGHSIDIARNLVNAQPGQIPEMDSM